MTDSSNNQPQPIEGQGDLLEEIAAVVHRERLRRADIRRAAGEALTEGATEDDERAQIDALIRRFAATGNVFSANDLRPYLPNLESPRVLGSRFSTAARRGLIRKVGHTITDGDYSHGGDVKTWVGAKGGSE